MSGWLKVEKATASKREIAILARKLCVPIADAFLNWFLVYSWADGATATGFVAGITPEDVDTIAYAKPGTTAALASAEIGWVSVQDGGIMFARWDRHNGKSAKARALEAEAKRLRRSDEDDLSDNVGHLPDALSDQMRGDERRREEDRTLTCRQDSVRREPSDLPPLDLSGMTDQDWSEVIAIAEAAARRVPPVTANDRRQWLKFAVLAQQSFGEHWMLDSAEAVKQAKQTKRNRQAHFVAVLKAQAKEKHGTSPEDLKGMCRRIDIPADIWKSNFLPAKEVSHGKA